MKKLLILGGLTTSFFLSAQCIKGEQNLYIGEEYTFSIDKNLAQCPDCHHWLIKSDLFKINGEQKKNTIKIVPQKVGDYEISSAVLTPSGLKNCSLKVNVSERSTLKVENTTTDCSVNVSDFKEIKVDPTNVILYPNNRTMTYNYTWEITYKNGKTIQISDIVPTVSRSVNNEIKTIVMRVLTTHCVRTFTKNYDDTFWKYY